MVVMIVLYCLIAAILVIGLSLRTELSAEQKRKQRKGPARVINIDTGRRPVSNLHKHASR